MLVLRRTGLCQSSVCGGGCCRCLCCCFVLLVFSPFSPLFWNLHSDPAKKNWFLVRHRYNDSLRHIYRHQRGEDASCRQAAKTAATVRTRSPAQNLTKFNDHNQLPPICHPFATATSSETFPDKELDANQPPIDKEFSPKNHNPKRDSDLVFSCNPPSMISHGISMVSHVLSQIEELKNHATQKTAPIKAQAKIYRVET